MPIHSKKRKLGNVLYANSIKYANQKLCRSFEVTFNFFAYISCWLVFRQVFIWPGHKWLSVCLFYLARHGFGYLAIQFIYLFMKIAYAYVQEANNHSSKLSAIFHWDLKIIFMHLRDGKRRYKQNFDFGLLTQRHGNYGKKRWPCKRCTDKWPAQ